MSCYSSAGQAAAGAAEGALGRGRPAASGSRWRRKAARQDFSRSADARPLSGIASVIRPIREARAKHAPSAPTRTATASAVIAVPEGPEEASSM